MTSDGIFAPLRRRGLETSNTGPSPLSALSIQRRSSAVLDSLKRAGD